jgi:hypothetical protein
LEGQPGIVPQAIVKDSRTGQPLSEEDVEENWVTIVHEFSELEGLAAANPDNVDAIVIDGSRLHDTNQSWLQGQYQQGRVIAGVNTALRDLGRFVGDDFVANDLAWTEGWQQEPFYSILAFKPTGTSDEQARARAEGRLLGGASRSTDNIRNHGDVDVFLSLIRRDIRELRELEEAKSSN